MAKWKKKFVFCWAAIAFFSAIFGVMGVALFTQNGMVGHILWALLDLVLVVNAVYQIIDLNK